MKKKSYDNEIDLADLIFNLWNNKIKIIVIIVSFVILGFLYFYYSNTTYKASTNIKPISTFESQKYELFNNFVEEKKSEENKDVKGILKVNRNILLSLFRSKIRTEELIEKSIRKFQLIDEDNLKDEKDYEEQIKRTAILIIDQITPPLLDEKNKSKNIPYWKFNFQVTDIEKWKSFLKYIEKQANEEIRQSLLNKFDTEIKIIEISSKFKIEDIEQNIKNELADYKTSTRNRLAFLKEQAEIARTLNIARNTLEAENFQSGNTIVTDIKSENSYYLKGYEMIEKEINLINSRENEKAFISNLLKLEKNKRAILQNKQIERLKNLFLETPVHNVNGFKAAKIDYVATNYKAQSSLPNILIISGVVGLLISFMNIFLNSIIRSRK
jgi:LPS O-antigen subunit length determinant protein (WzzB/FepE family)